MALAGFLVAWVRQGLRRIRFRLEKGSSYLFSPVVSLKCLRVFVRGKWADSLGLVAPEIKVESLVFFSGRSEYVLLLNVVSPMKVLGSWEFTERPFL